jgi:hypothetical protein
MEKVDMKNSKGLPEKLGKPAERALISAGYTSLLRISKATEKEISQLHGVGPTAIIKIKEAMRLQGLSFSGER